MSKRQTLTRLTPTRVIGLFLLVFALVSLHEMEHLTTWFEESCHEWTGDAEGWCQTTQQSAVLKQATAFSQKLIALENRLLEFTQALPEVGAASPEPEPTPSPENDTAATDTSKAAPTQTENTAEKQAPQSTVLQPQKVLIVGDSMVLEGFGLSLQRQLTQFDNLSVIREGKYSTGLSRPDYFDWPTHLATLVKEHHPDLIIVNMGANDPQDIVIDGKRHHVGSDSWNAIYSKRIKRFLSIAADRNITTFWVGLPIMGKAKYSQSIQNINALAADACEKLSMAYYVDTWKVLTDSNGAYATFLQNAQGNKVRVRAKDKIHLTSAGGEIMTHHFLSSIKPYVKWPEL